MFNGRTNHRKSGTRHLAHQNDPLLALSLLTRLPLRLPDAAFERSAQAAWAYPLVGLATGLCVALAGYLALALGLPALIAAIVALGAGIIVTGAMHEDGLADCADGFWGGWDKEMRLKIMKDSQIGTYGVLALALSLALRLSALALIFAAPSALCTLIAVHVGSRAVMPAIMASLPNAREGGLSAQVGQVSGTSAVQAAAIGVLALIIGLGFAPAIMAVLAVCLACLAGRKIAQAKIGGQTGDVIGAHQQIAEITLLMCAICLL